MRQRGRARVLRPLRDDSSRDFMREWPADAYNGERATAVGRRFGDDRVRGAGESPRRAQGSGQAARGNAMDSPGSSMRTDSAR